ncbi:hypothetical protein [Palleronia sp. THAF1]|uniref:hypothetical protein n=1 Tax=Palleronia sp. THAF1 TaxID=2587842 RepID=UPI000F537D18|nr:hypothetical protein [Palleronia sp. THAF1]
MSFAPLSSPRDAARLTWRLVRNAVLIGIFGILALAEVARAEELAAGELRALRYYLEQGDQRSAQAEMRRLRALHPDWVPPASLEELKQVTSAPSGPGEDANRIWKLIEIGNFTAARGRLDHLRGVHPNWEPPTEMVRLLSLGEAQQNFDAAVSAGDAGTAINVVRKTPQILRCDRVNNAWQLAVMQRKAGDTNGALNTYRGVLGSCTDSSVVVATLEKSNEIASPEQLSELADHARRSRPALTPSIDVVERRLLGGGAPQKQTAEAPAPAAQKPAVPAAPAQTPAPAQTTQATQPSQPVPAGKLPAKGDGRVDSVRAAAKIGDWASCLARSTNPRSIDILYERAWCAYNKDRTLEALAAFRVASTAPLGATVQRDARFGMTLALLANWMTEDAARLAASTNLTQTQRVQVEGAILDQRGVRAFQLDRFEESINYLNALEKLTGSIRRDLAVMRAYAYLNSGQRQVAREQFQMLHDQMATTETRKGLSAAMN